ncbi:MAG: OmpA family protein [Prevotella sp.]|nr:OmpA family protein [Prevotella sp.]
MKKMKFMTLGMCLAVLVSCGTATKNGALIGTGAGAALGAIIGKIAGNTAVGAAIGGAVGAGTGALIGKHMDKVKAQAEAVQNAQVESVTDANGLQAVKVTFDSGILFATSSSTLSATAKNSLSKFAEVLKQNTDCDVAVQGYTDNTGWRNSTAEQSVQKNLNLSQERAQAVTNYLTSLGVSTNQIRSTTGFGESNPVADNSTAAGKAQNRRVEVYLYASQAMIQAAEAGTLQ